MAIQPAEKDDEIDIVQFIRRTLALFIRYRTVFGWTIGLGLGSGLAYYFSTPRVYESALLASCNVLTGAQVKNLVAVLDQLAQEGNGVLLGQKLHVNQRLAGSLKSFEAVGLLEVDQQRTKEQLSPRDSSVFTITVGTTDPGAFDSLQAGILYYLQQNRYTQKVLAIRKQNLELMQHQLQLEARRLDSLRGSVYNLIARTNPNDGMMLLDDPSSVNRDILDLYTRELDIRRQLTLLDNIQIIQDFTSYSRAASPKLAKSLAIGAGAGLAAGLLLLLLLEARRLVAATAPS